MAKNQKKILQTDNLREFLPIDDSTMMLFLDTWNRLPKYVLQEKVLENIFKKFPGNTDVDEVLLKCTLLNEFYSTRINSSELIELAQNIVKLDIDGRLRDGDWSVVPEIAVCVGNRAHISFASKYCNWHNQNAFPIYDKYVVEVLCALKGNELMSFRTNRELREDPDIKRRYNAFGTALVEFVNRFNLKSVRSTDSNEIIFKLLDRALWLMGKLCFGDEVSVPEIIEAAGEILTRAVYERYISNRALKKPSATTDNKKQKDTKKHKTNK